MKIYLANGLFSQADYEFNAKVAEYIRDNIEYVNLFVPQEQEINDKNSYADSQQIFQLDFDNVKDSDLIIAIVDGVEIDSGVACEIGIARALNIPIIALYTDVRRLGASNLKKINALMADTIENQFMYRNLFVVGAVKSNGVVVNSLGELVSQVLKYKSK